MENQFHPIDDYFKSQAAGMSSPLSPEEKAAIWSGVLNVRKKRFVPFWWMSGALAILILLTGFYIYNKTDEDNADQSPQQPVDIPIAAEESVPSEGIVQAVDVPIDETVIHDEGLNSHDTHLETVSAGSKHYELNEGDVTESLTLSKSSTETNIVGQKSQIQNDHFSSGIDEAFPSTENRSKVETAQNMGIKTLSDKEQQKAEVAVAETNAKVKNFTQVQSDFLYSTISPLTLRESVIDYRHNPLYLVDGMQINCGMKTKWSLDVYSSVSKPFVSINERSPQATELAAQWKESFDPQWLYSVGVIANYHLSRRWSIGAGLELQRLTSYSTHIEEDRGFKLNWNDQAYYFLNEAGEREWVGDSVLTAVNSTRGMKRANNHNRIVIPFQLSYQLPINKWSIVGGLGMALSVYQNNHAYIYKETGLFEKAEDEWNTAMSFDGRLAIGVSYAIRPEWELFLQSSLQVGLTDRLNEEFPLAMDIHFAGLSIGTRKYL